MAIQRLTSDQLTPTTSSDGIRLRPVSEHGKRRIQYFKFTNTTGATIDAGSTIDLVKLPQGAKRVTPHNSRFQISAAIASATISFGMRQFSASMTSDPVAEDPVAISDTTQSLAALPATVNGLPGTFPMGGAMKKDFFSTNEPTVFATIAGAAIPVGWAIEGMLEYVYE